MNSSFKGAMVWYTGVVEDIQDPEQLGRVRVRCYGYHTENKVDLPTEALPWAIPITPVTSAGVSGVGESATGLIAGSWVVGFFRDGETAQDPVVLGSIPTTSYSDSDKNENKGFSDPDKNAPRAPGTPDIPKTATVNYDQSDFYLTKKSLREEEIPLAAKPSITLAGSEEQISWNNSPNRSTWNMLDVEENTKPVYPYNHVTEYASGHLFEIDETKERERICRIHKSGTYDEYTADGSRTLLVKGDDYKVIFKDEKVYIKGACNLTIDQDCNTYIKGNYNLEVEKDFNMRIGGSLKRKVKGNKLTEVGGDQNTNMAGNELFKAAGNEIKRVNGEDGSLKMIKHDLTEDIEGNRDAFVTGSMNFKVDENIRRLCKGTATVKSDGDMLIQSQTKINLEGGDEIRENAARIYMN